MKLYGIKCNKCQDVVFSRSRHDMRFCHCGAVAIDGGPHRFNYVIEKLQGTASYMQITGNHGDWKLVVVTVDLEMHDLIEDYSSRGTTDDLGQFSTLSKLPAYVLNIEDAPQKETR